MNEFARTLAEIADLKKEEKWEEVIKIVGVNLNRLVRTSPQEFRRLTETGLLARLVSDGPTIWVPYKLMMLIALLKETGDYATIRKPPRGGLGWYLKALHLLLDALARGEIRQEIEFVPKIDVLLSAMAGSSLPVGTRLLLMREYERLGHFERVKDEFVAALEKAPKNPDLLNYGIAFFERLSCESDGPVGNQ
jgi:hypothetical protein